MSMKSHHSPSEVSIYLLLTQMIELEKRKDVLLSTASHELKTPITTLKGFTQILQQLCSEDPRICLYLSKMNYQIDRITELVNDLLDVSRLRSGKLELQQELFEIDQLVEEVVSDLQLTIKIHQITIEGRTNSKVWGDKFRLSQVLDNLINNAVKFSPKGKVVKVSCQRMGKKVLISIEDRGIGIAKKHLSSVFEPFFQGETKIRQSFSGLGLGLYISKQIILKHGGDIEVKSEKGIGSTFAIRLPSA